MKWICFDFSEATNFIKECGNLMNLGYATMHTAIVYMHRFYMFHSFKTFPRYVTACSCLFLAGKVVSYRRFRLIITVNRIFFAGGNSKKVQGHHQKGGDNFI